MLQTSSFPLYVYPAERCMARLRDRLRGCVAVRRLSLGSILIRIMDEFGILWVFIAVAGIARLGNSVTEANADHMAANA
ncbi:hypothetical protein GCM10012320_17720 [Sinomonas cellulolyticus]|nr:hypothetical protein GCM10012320_17720 [Sinomonas sp. KCTC 49339]